MSILTSSWRHNRPPDGTFTINHDSTQAVGLRAWWPFLASRGGDQLFEIINGNRSDVFTGSPVWTADPEMGFGLDFDGSNDAIVVPDSPSLDIDGDQITLIAWCNPSSLNRVVIGKPHAATHTSPFFKYALFKSGTNLFQIRIDTTFLNSNAVAPLNSVYLIVGTYDGANLRIYVNGIDEGNTTKTGNIEISSIDLRIGENVDGNERWNGSIYEARVLDYAYSPSQVWQLWDPLTRWDLYQPVSKIWAVRAPVAAGVEIFRRRRASAHFGI